MQNSIETRGNLCTELGPPVGCHAISFQIEPWVAFGLPYLLIELFYIGMPVVRTDRWTYGHVITKFLGCVDYHIFLPMVLRYNDLWILRRGRLREQDFHTTFSKVVRAGESGSFWPEKVENENVVVVETSFIKCQKFCLFCDWERAML